VRLVFLGSGEFGLPTLKWLLGPESGHFVAAVVSQPDRPAGRHRELTPTPIAAYAQQQGVLTFKSDDVNTPEFIAQIDELKPDAAVVIAFGQKLSPPLIGALGKLAVNLHASLLPKFRGAAPINWAMINGEKVTGVTVISLAQRMDAGLVYARAETPIDPLETAGELHDRLATLGPELIEKLLADLERGELRGEPQDEAGATKAPKLSKADAIVSFNAPADEVRRRIHGLTPWPGVRVTWRRQSDGKEQPLSLLRVAAETSPSGQPPGTVLEGQRVATADGAVRLLEVQTPGGRAMRIEDFVRGHPLQPGDMLR
jgi:methionyl-tRNA formyltransferase